MPPNEFSDGDTWWYENHFAPNNGKISTLYHLFVPKSVRRRLQKLTSPRDFEEDDSSAESSGRDSRRSTRAISLPPTPPPVYTSDVSICSSGTDSETEKDERRPKNRSSWKRRRDISRGHSSAQFFASTDSESGIRWRFANQALNLLSLSAQESSATVHGSKQGQPTLTRQLYIHALTYGLRALPVDLSKEEVIDIAAALPDGIAQIASSEENKHQLVRDERMLANRTADQPSMLHRVLALFILQIFVLLKFLMPHLIYFAGLLYGFERQHQISKRVLVSSVSTVNAVMKMGDSVCQISDGKVGQVIDRSMDWCITGIIGGLQEGVGEGLAIIKVDKSTSDTSSQRGFEKSNSLSSD